MPEQQVIDYVMSLEGRTNPNKVNTAVERTINH
ncbi:hypothetical protein VCR14J2_230155 [Vibrio coralliirubri]|nr:hypothetical protein VCR14J2_230155 [Vibrio coralliirubri]